jgi:hypothetical protein
MEKRCWVKSYNLYHKPKPIIMTAANKAHQDRVRRSSTEAVNQEIDRHTAGNILRYGYAGTGVISNRLQELDQEWDIEKTLEVNASSLALASLALGTLVNKRWYILTGVVAGFLLQHGLQGWCPPLPLFRKLGIRTKKEIHEERTALKILRGDFRDLGPAPQPAELRDSIRRR